MILQVAFDDDGNLILPQKTQHADQWAATWRAALKNMPTLKGRDKGRYTALVQLLGLRAYSKGGHYKGHSTVFNACYRRGYRPKGMVPDSEMSRAVALQLLAGPFGTLIAYARFSKLGMVQRYDWPRALRGVQ